MDHRDFQLYLAALPGIDPGPIDGIWGRRSQAALELAWTRGPDTPLSLQDFVNVSADTAIPVAHLRAVRKVEAGPTGYQNGRMLILPEPHWFSRLTNRRFDATHPALSYPSWGTRPYPRTQQARYEQLLAMIALDPDAGIESASYGAFQILGVNYRECGYASALDFVIGMSHSELPQLQAMIAFCKSKGLTNALRRGDWTTFAAGYNGPAFRKNNYHVKLAAAAASFR